MGIDIKLLHLFNKIKNILLNELICINHLVR